MLFVLKVCPFGSGDGPMDAHVALLDGVFGPIKTEMLSVVEILAAPESDFAPDLEERPS
jgi:hypothetical protein